MPEPSLELQKAVRARLTGFGDLIAIVPPGHILDRNSKPEGFPCVLIGEGGGSYANDYDDFADRPSLDLHIYVEETGLEQAKIIAGTIRAALRPRPWNVAGYVCADLRVSNGRFLRDPTGQHSHGILTVEAVLQEA